MKSIIYLRRSISLITQASHKTSPACNKRTINDHHKPYIYTYKIIFAYSIFFMNFPIDVFEGNIVYKCDYFL